MISNNSKQELKHKINELEGRLAILNAEKDKHQAEIDFIAIRKQNIKDIIDDLKADVA